MKQRTLAVVSAGLSQPSSTRLLADQLSVAVESAAARLGVQLVIEMIELRDLAHDITNHLLTGFPPGELKRALDTVAGADAVIAVTPIFNASYSGLFKSFFDVLDHEALADKPVLMAATGGSARHSLALEHALRPMFAYLRAVVVPTSVYGASEDWGGDADAAGGALRVRIDRAAAELARELDRREPVTVADPFALTTSFEQLLANG
jgi:FMN reductase